MSIFTSYPKINYKIDDYDYLVAIDITNTFRVRQALKRFRGISYQPYVVQDGERPDNVSQKLYDSPNYDWIILLVNDIFNLYDEWPRDRETFKQYIIEKYGSLSNAQSTIKFYYDENKNIIDVTTYNALPPARRSLENVYEYELRLNTNKSIIKVPTFSIVKLIESDIRTLNTKAAI
jgi:hypothetical protein